MKAIDNNKDKLTPSDIYTILEKKTGKKQTEKKRIGYIVESTTAK